MRTTAIIQQDMDRCQNQIEATLRNNNMSLEDKNITLEGFNRQLNKLKGEMKTATRALPVNEPETINPKL